MIIQDLTSILARYLIIEGIYPLVLFVFQLCMFEWMENYFNQAQNKSELLDWLMQRELYMMEQGYSDSEVEEELLSLAKYIVNRQRGKNTIMEELYGSADVERDSPETSSK